MGCAVGVVVWFVFSDFRKKSLTISCFRIIFPPYTPSRSSPLTGHWPGQSGVVVRRFGSEKARKGGEVGADVFLVNFCMEGRMVPTVFKLTPAEDDELSRFERAVRAEMKRRASFNTPSARAIQCRLKMAWRDKLRRDQWVDRMQEMSICMHLAESIGFLDMLVAVGAKHVPGDQTGSDGVGIPDSVASEKSYQARAVAGLHGDLALTK